MSDPVLPSYDALQEALNRLEMDSHPAEVQGRLCGMVCSLGEVPLEEWYRRMAITAPAGDALAAEAKERLEALHRVTRLSMHDPHMGFGPLLPPDDIGLGARVEALGDWCLGFLEGLAEGGVRDLDQLPGDAGEVARDLLELSRASEYEFEGGEEDEAAFAELEEYLRTGTLLVLEEMQPTKAPPLGGGAILH
ncbi:MAG: UPF0149 family protein [Pseudomonadota bacterium]